MGKIKNKFGEIYKLTEKALITQGIALVIK
jgi:hypothetical protein